MGSERDWILLGEHWTTVFEATRVPHLPRISSDNAPFLVRCQALLQIPRPSFRFQNMWTRHHSFKEDISRAWEADTRFFGMLNIQFKISRIKDFLKRWNRDVFGNIFERRWLAWPRQHIMGTLLPHTWLSSAGVPQSMSSALGWNKIFGSRKPPFDWRQRASGIPSSFMDGSDRRGSSAGFM